MRGNQFEPGDRDGSAPTILKLDMTNIDKRQARKSSAKNPENDSNRGRVTITPVADTPKTTPEAEQPPTPIPVDKATAPVEPAATPIEPAATPIEPVATPIEPVADTPASEADTVSLISTLAEEAKEE